MARAVGHPEWIDDPRFATIEARAGNTELITAFDEIFAGRPLAEWGEIFDDGNVWWAPMQEIHEVLDDPEGDHGWAIEGVVDLAACDEAGEVRFASLALHG